MVLPSGQADCPYYARAELLGDKLAINLPDFKLHKIVKTPEEWQVLVLIIPKNLLLLVY